MMWHLDRNSIDEIDHHEYAYTKARMSVSDAPGFEFTEKNGLKLLKAPFPNPFFNRIFGVNPDNVQYVESFIKVFGSTPFSIDLSPGNLNEPAAKTLSDLGLAHTSFHSVLACDLSQVTHVDTNPVIEVRKVRSANDVEFFFAPYLAGWGMVEQSAEIMHRNIKKWAQLDNWHMYYALKDTQPIAAAILSMHGTSAYLADSATAPNARKHGAQTALLGARLEDARILGAISVFSRADLGETSQRNMGRYNIRPAFNRAVWTKL